MAGMSSAPADALDYLRKTAGEPRVEVGPRLDSPVP